MKNEIQYITMDTYQHQPDYVFLIKRDRKNYLWADIEHTLKNQHTIYYYNGDIMKCSIFISVPGNNKFRLHQEEEYKIESLSAAIADKFYRFSLLISPHNTISMTLKKLDIPLAIQNIIYNHRLIKELEPLYQVVSEKRILPMCTSLHRQHHISNL